MTRKRAPTPGTVKKLLLQALSEVDNDARRRVLDALALKRRNPDLSLSAAAKASGTTLRTIRRHAPSALITRPNGRLNVTKTDHLTRVMRMLTGRGEVVVTTHSFRTASRIGKYNNAIRQYLVIGDPLVLQPFAGKSVRASGQTYEFLTDTRTINRLARAGAAHFVDVYAADGKA